MKLISGYIYTANQFLKKKTNNNNKKVNKKTNTRKEVFCNRQQ